MGPVLGLPAVARLHMPELEFEDSERVFDTGTDLRDDLVDPPT